MDRNKNSRRRRKKYIRIFGHSFVLWRLAAFAALFAVFAVSAGMLIDYGVQSLQRKMDNAQLSDQYEESFLGEVQVSASPTPVPVQTPEPTAAPMYTLAPYYHDFSGETPARARNLYNQNNDLVGWLYIKGVVSLPVVQRDNSFYLDHDFNGKKSSGGTLFLDQYHPMVPETQHLLIHGHNMYDSSMFGIVSNYNKLQQVKSSGFATFSSMHAPEEYVICAVLQVNPDPNSSRYFNYVGTPNFAIEDDFNRFAKELKDRSMFDIPVDIKPSDALLSLSTCIDEDRLLVVFRRIREEENKDDLRQLVSQSARK